MDNLQSRIKTSRINRGLSQAALAQRAGVSQPTVANWENGSHVPRHAVLEKIGEALGVEPMWLLSGDFLQGHSPAQAYTQHPIRHLPIYDWPQSEYNFLASPPIGFIPFSTRRENLFGLMVYDETANASKVTICNPYEAPDLKPGNYLIASPKGPQTKHVSELKDDGNKIYGRIVSKMYFYR